MHLKRSIQCYKSNFMTFQGREWGVSPRAGLVSLPPSYHSSSQCRRSQDSGIAPKSKVYYLQLKVVPPESFFLNLYNWIPISHFPKLFINARPIFMSEFVQIFLASLDFYTFTRIHPIFIRNTAFGVQIYVRMSRLRQQTLIRYAFKDLVIGQLSEHGRHLCRSHLLCL